MRVGINRAIMTRGISGTATVTSRIESVLGSETDISVVGLDPPPRPDGHLRRAAFDASWDLWRAARTVSGLDALISPCNVGAAPKGLPHILWIHDTMPIDHPEWYDRRFAAYARLAFGISARLSTVVVTPSSESAHRIERCWSTKQPVRVLPWPVEDRKAVVRQSTSDPLAVIMVGATEVVKNHVGGIEAVQLARKDSGRDLSLTIIGPAGRAEHLVAQKAASVDPDRRWLRRCRDISGVELEAAYRDASALLHPALDEGFGLPLLEAASFALPIVHTGRGPMAEVVPQMNAGSVDPRQLADCLMRLLDRDRYSELSACSLAAAKAHSLAAFRNGLRQILDDALAFGASR